VPARPGGGTRASSCTNGSCLPGGEAGTAASGTAVATASTSWTMSTTPPCPFQVLMNCRSPLISPHDSRGNPATARRRRRSARSMWGYLRARRKSDCGAVARRHSATAPPPGDRAAARPRQRLVHVPCIAVNRTVVSYRGDGKTNATDAAIIPDQARMRRDLRRLQLDEPPSPSCRWATTHRSRPGQ
jgi:hypothetical protein